MGTNTVEIRKSVKFGSGQDEDKDKKWPERLAQRVGSGRKRDKAEEDEEYHIENKVTTQYGGFSNILSWCILAVFLCVVVIIIAKMSHKKTSNNNRTLSNKNRNHSNSNSNNNKRFLTWRV